MNKDIEEEVQTFKDSLVKEQKEGGLDRVIIAYPVVKDHPMDDCPFCGDNMVEHRLPGNESTPLFACDTCPWCYVRYENKEEGAEYAQYRRVESKANSLND